MDFHISDGVPNKALKLSNILVHKESDRDVSRHAEYFVSQKHCWQRTMLLLEKQFRRQVVRSAEDPLVVSHVMSNTVDSLWCSIRSFNWTWSLTEYQSTHAYTCSIGQFLQTHHVLECISQTYWLEKVWVLPARDFLQMPLKGLLPGTSDNSRCKIFCRQNAFSGAQTTV